MSKLRVLVVDDTIIYRKVLSDAAEATGITESIKAVPNAIIALEWLKQNEVDVILLDVFMPEMDGLEALKIIKEKYPKTEVIMVSSNGKESVENTVKALGLGAMEFIVKPSDKNIDNNREKIKRHLSILFRQIQINKVGQRRGIASIDRTEDFARKAPILNTKIEKKPLYDMHNIKSKENFVKKGISPDLILITSSTGGPAALDVIFKAFTKKINKPILMVQHMPKDFTAILAKSLNEKSILDIKEGQEGENVKRDLAIIAPGGYHMVIDMQRGSMSVKLNTDKHVNGVRPAADVLFSSVAKLYAGKNILAVVLTGMGSDGTQGVRELKEKCDCYCISQSEESCVIYGMPRMVEEAGLSDEVLPLNKIAKRIEEIVLR